MAREERQECRMDLIRDVLMLSPVIVYWSGWMFGLVIAAPIVLLLCRARWLDVAVVAATSIAVVTLMPLWHAQVGYVRLIGLPHIVIWTPLAIYLYHRRRHFVTPGPVRWTMAALMATIVVSLGFDYVDVLRYLLGERAPLV